MTKIELYDCTLREGNQTPGVSFNIDEKIRVVKALDDFGMDFIELAWPYSPDEEKRNELASLFEIVKALVLRNSKISAFGSTSMNNDVAKDENLKSIIRVGVGYACIFGKAWKDHVEKQLRISLVENLRRIEDSIKFLRENGMNVFYDAEHFFDGYKDSKDYALETLRAAIKGGASCLVLCDTRGGTLPWDIEEIVKETYDEMGLKNDDVHLGLHLHDDSGMALSSVLNSLRYIRQVQGTVNGVGERIGNLDLCTFVPTLVFKDGRSRKINLDDGLKRKWEEKCGEGKLRDLCSITHSAAGTNRNLKQAYFSPYAFAHKGGVHTDAIKKGASYEHVSPAGLGLDTRLIMNSSGGSACIVDVAEKFGYDVDKRNSDHRNKINSLLKELEGLENKGYDLGLIDAEQWLLMEKYFGNPKRFFRVIEWNVNTNKRRSTCTIVGDVNGDMNVAEKDISSAGPIDAAYKSMEELIGKKYDLSGLRLIDFHVGIASASGEASTVRTMIEFFNDRPFETVGVHGNIIASGIEALEKGFNYYLQRKYH